MVDTGAIMQVLRFSGEHPPTVPLPVLLEALPGITGFERGYFLASVESPSVEGVLVWRDEAALLSGMAELTASLGAAPPQADQRRYRILGRHLRESTPITVARSTMRPAITTAERVEAWHRSVSERILPAWHGFDDFAGILWGRAVDGDGVFGIELWSDRPANEPLLAALSRQPMPPGLDPALIAGDAVHEWFNVVGTAPLPAPA